MSDRVWGNGWRGVLVGKKGVFGWWVATGHKGWPQGTRA